MKEGKLNNALNILKNIKAREAMMVMAMVAVVFLSGCSKQPSYENRVGDWDEWTVGGIRSAEDKQGNMIYDTVDAFLNDWEGGYGFKVENGNKIYKYESGSKIIIFKIKKSTKELNGITYTEGENVLEIAQINEDKIKINENMYMDDIYDTLSRILKNFKTNKKVIGILKPCVNS